MTPNALALFLLVIPLVVMSFAKDRQDRYTLPMIPAAATVAAIGVKEYLSRWDRPDVWNRIIATLHWLTLGSIAVIFPILAATPLLKQTNDQPWFDHRFAAMEAGLGGAMLLFGILMHRRRPGTLLTISVAIMLVFQAVAFRGYVKSAAGRSELKPLADLLVGRYPGASFYNAHPRGKHRRRTGRVSQSHDPLHFRTGAARRAKIPRSCSCSKTKASRIRSRRQVGTWSIAPSATKIGGGRSSCHLSNRRKNCNREGTKGAKENAKKSNRVFFAFSFSESRAFAVHLDSFAHSDNDAPTMFTEPITDRFPVIEKYIRGVDVMDLGCVDSRPHGTTPCSTAFEYKANLLHKHIAESNKSVLGVDIDPEGLRGGAELAGLQRHRRRRRDDGLAASSSTRSSPARSSNISKIPADFCAICTAPEEPTG